MVLPWNPSARWCGLILQMLDPERPYIIFLPQGGLIQSPTGDPLETMWKGPLLCAMLRGLQGA